MDRTNPAVTPVQPHREPPRGSTHGSSPRDAASCAPIARRRDQDPLAALARTAGAAMLGAAYRVLGPRGHEAADAVQDAWCYVLAHPQALAAVRPGTEVTWLAGVARNAALNRLRRRHVRDRHELTDPEVLSELPGPAPEVPPYGPQEIDAMDAVVAALAAQDKALLTLAVVEELPCPEIARTLGIPRTTARDRLRVLLRRVSARALRVRHALRAR